MRYSINRHKYLSNQEFEYINARVIHNVTRDALIIRLALATGGRAQELLNLTHRDLDKVNNSVFIRGLKNSLDRDIPVDKALFDALMTHSSLIKTERLFAIGYDRLDDIWKLWTPNKDKTFHSLRHTFAIHLYKRTKDLMLVKAALGHVSISNTVVYMEHIMSTEVLKGILSSSS